MLREEQRSVMASKKRRKLEIERHTKMMSVEEDEGR